MDIKSVPTGVASELVALFDKAESRIKNLELLYEEGLFYHPVNQLRYAGYHIVRAIETTDEALKENECKKAKHHCQRAIYDASEMAIAFCLKEINSFQQDYKKVDITSTVDNYLDIKKVAREAQDLLRTTNHDTREEKYDECDKCFELLKPYVDRLDDARPELNKCLISDRRNFFLAITALTLTGVGIIVAIAAWAAVPAPTP